MNKEIRYFLFRSSTGNIDDSIKSTQRMQCYDVISFLHFLVSDLFLHSNANLARKKEIMSIRMIEINRNPLDKGGKKNLVVMRREI